MNTRPWRGLVRIALALAGTVLGWEASAVAHAATLTAEPDGVLIYEVNGDFAQPHDVTVTQDADSGDYRVFDALAAVEIDPSAPCDPGMDPREAFCDDQLVSILSVILGNRSDRLVNDTSLSMAACGGLGSDVLAGGSEDDRLSGGSGPDELFGREGRDVLGVSLALGTEACEQQGVDHFELLDGGPGPDQVEAGPGNDLIEGGPEDDLVFGHGGTDRVDAGAGSDIVLGLDGADSIEGDDGRDFLFGGGGDDLLEGGPGDDVLGKTVRHEPAILSVGGTPVVSPETGDDRLAGGEGDDDLTAGPGDNVFDIFDPLGGLEAGFIDRRLESAARNGADKLAGGPGIDTVSYLNQALPVDVTLDGLANDGAPGERDRVDPDIENVLGGAASDIMTAGANRAFLFGDRGEDVLTGGPANDILSGGGDDDDDRLAGAGGDDELRGGPGRDVLEGQAGEDALIAGGGDDRLLGGAGSDGLEGGTGSDRLDGGTGADCLHGFVFSVGFGNSTPACPQGVGATPALGADGDDLLRGGPARDLLAGGGGEDIADYSGSRARVFVFLPEASMAAIGASRLGAAAFGTIHMDELAPDVEGARGGLGHDVLVGNARDNLLDGGPGDDDVRGGAGDDRLRGGSGLDLVVSRDGQPDAVRCGTRSDHALVDREDEIVSGLTDSCEHVDGAGSARMSRSATIAPVGRCELPFRPRGAARRFLLPGRAALAWRTAVDARSCPAALWAPGRPARARRAAILDLGSFVLGRAGRGSSFEARLTGGRATACRGPSARVRRLRVRNAPRGFAVRARAVRAVGPGASWTTIDGCRGTLIRVLAGRVTVRRGRRQVVLRRGQALLTPVRSAAP